MRRDQLALHKGLKQFSLKKIIPHPDGMPPNLGKSSNGRPASGSTCRSIKSMHTARANRGPAFQVMLAESNDSEWIFRRIPEIRMPISRMGFHPLWGLPYLAPEIVLLFKAKHLEGRDRIDFENALPALSVDARRWLRDALEKTHPGHEWLYALLKER